MIEISWPVLLLLLIAVLLAAAASYAAGFARGRLRFEAPLSAAQTESLVLREQLAERDEYLAQRDRYEERDSDTARVLGPMSAALAQVQQQVTRLERDRATHFGQLSEQLGEVTRATSDLRTQTAALAGSLNASTIRGSWGESQLRRVLEYGGLLARCDFDEQVSARTRHDAAVRPDVVIRLPAGKYLVIDAKAPMSAFLAAQAANIAPRQRTDRLAEHATQLRAHVTTLAGKAYWSAFPEAPEMVVCFVPGDAMLAAALDADPALFDDAMARKVVLASPATLLALARTVAYVWRQDSLTQNAQQLLDLGRELHTRLGTLAAHLTRMGGSLRKSVDSYNSLIGAVETRVLVTTRKMQALGLADDSPEVPALDATVRPMTAPELLGELPGGPDGPGEASLAAADR